MNSSILTHLKKILCLVAAIAVTGAPSSSLAASGAEESAAAPLALDSTVDPSLDEEAAKLSREPVSPAKAAVAPAIAAPRYTTFATPLGTAVSVTATGGTTGPTTYPTLNAAFAAINAGTHQGAVTVSILASTTEPGPAVLNGNGAGTASYTSVLIQPGVDGVTVAGATPQGRGLIELNGASNVVINGDNPNTSGVNRNLTLQNTAANTVTFTSVIRIALAATVVNTANDNAFANLNIIGSSPGRNVTGATSTTASENTTFGIFAGPGGSTTSNTTPPVAVTSVSTGVGAGATANNLLISNNNFTGSMARAISMNGSAASVFGGLQITSNFIGNPTAGSPDQVTAIGITVNGATNAVVQFNVVHVEGLVSSSAAGHGINTGVTSANTTGTLIHKNHVVRVLNNSPSTFAAFGINLGGGSNHTVQNNFVTSVRNNQTAGTGGFSALFGAYGIRVASGTGHKIYHNSAHLSGVIPGNVSTNLSAAFIISATTLTGVDVRNNIFSNQLSGGNPTGTRHTVVALASGGTTAMNLIINNNDYFQGNNSPFSTLAQVGFAFGTGEYQTANFNPSATTPANNFRAYTSTLGNASNDDSSVAVNPQFVSDVDLHLAAGSIVLNRGAALGVIDDIDNQPRQTPPDLGADEANGLLPPTNDIATNGVIEPQNGAIRSTASPITPQASFTNTGSATQTNVLVRFRIVNSSNMVVYDMTATIPSLASGATVIVTFPSTTISTPGNYTAQAIAELPGDENAGNNSATSTFSLFPPLAAGTYTVGTGGNYPSLTTPGGIFEAMNLGGVAGDIVINIISDLTTETGQVPLNSFSGGFSVTIKPSGGARVVSGTSATSSALIILNGADRVTIDGSLTGGTDRSLTITNNQATTGIVIWMRSPSASDGATNNTVKNCVINGAPGPNSTTVAGVLTGSGVTLGSPAEAANSNNTIQNNWIHRVQNSLFLAGGTAAANFDQNWMIADNEMGSANPADRNIFRGMLIGNASNFTITRNFVHGIQSTATTTAAMNGIQLAFMVNTGTITRNVISDIKNISATGTGAFGITVSATSTASNVTIANNFVSDIAANGSATVGSNGFGIVFTSTTGGSGYNLFFNSINLGTNQATAGTSAAVFIAATFNTAGAIDARNNIFANTQTTGTRYGVYSLAPATVFSMINYNDYFAQNVGFIGGSARPTLMDWQAATGQDANSLAVDPLFISPTNLHLGCGSPLLGVGTPATGISVDIDGQTRESPPDIGADEAFGPVAVTAFSRKTHGAAGTFDIPLPGVDPRSDGSGNHQVVFTFASPVTFTGATASGAAVSSTTGSGTNTVTVNLSGVANATRVTITLQCATDGSTSGDVITTVGFLQGDTNGNGTVTAADIGQVKSQSGVPLTAANFRSDLNANGAITAADIGIVKARAGTQLP
jgi:hypothetical protein